MAPSSFTSLPPSSREDDGAMMHAVAVGHEPFSLIPSHLVAADGTMDIEDLCGVLAALSSVISLALRAREASALSRMEQDGMGYLSMAISDAFRDLGAGLGDTLDNMLERIPLVQPSYDRARNRKRSGGSASDLSEPAMPHSKAGGL